MSEPYLSKLTQIINRLSISDSDNVTILAKHFFSGAALYANGTICVLFSPMGFAIKVPANRREILLAEGKGSIFRFFPNGPIKHEYIRLSDHIIQQDDTLGEFLYSSIEYVLERSS